MEEFSEINKVSEKYSSLLVDEKHPYLKDVSLEELGYLVKNFDKFLSSQHNIITSESIVIPRVTELIVSFGLVKTFEGSEDRDFDSKDFPYEASDAELCFEYLNCLLVHYEHIDTSSKRKFLVQALLLCATHHAKHFWSSEKTIALCADFLRNLLFSSKHKDLNALLCDDTFHPTIFKAILKWLRPILIKDTWMKTPSSCYVFYWVLHHVKHPHLVDYLPDILPPSFMFSSYYSVPQQVLGIKCFDHILDNVPPSLLKADGTEEAIFHALKGYLYSKEIPVIEVLYPCLLKLPMMNLQRVNQTAWLQFDTVLQQLLQNVDTESNAELRHLFLSQTYLFIKVTACFKHLKKALKVLYSNITNDTDSDEKCKIISLEIIQELLISCWPRMENHCFDIMLAIMKVICDIENPNYSFKDSSKVQSLCEACLYKLKKICPTTFKNLVNEYLQGEDSLPGANLLKQMLLEDS